MVVTPKVYVIGVGMTKVSERKLSFFITFERKEKKKSNSLVNDVLDLRPDRNLNFDFSFHSFSSFHLFGNEK